MRLSYIIEQLAFGELLNHKLASTGTIVSTDYPQIVAHVNAALTALHTEFALRKEQVIVQQHVEINGYYLTTDYAVSNTSSSASVKYIIDTVNDPFQDNILKIDKVVDENGCEYPLNIGNDCESLTTPIHNQINVPTPYDTNAMVVHYRANHPLINNQSIVPEQVELNIPTFLTRALTLFIGSRIYAGMTSLEGIQISQNMERQYNTEITKVKDNGMVNIESFNNTKVEDNQWA